MNVRPRKETKFSTAYPKLPTVNRTQEIFRRRQSKALSEIYRNSNHLLTQWLVRAREFMTVLNNTAITRSQNKMHSLPYSSYTNNNYKFNSVMVESLTIKAGATDIRGEGQVIQVVNATIHPEYLDLYYDYDFAILKLESSFDMYNYEISVRKQIF